ncbi:SGNH/GDSL hydrolase family protein [Pseudomonas cremoricolorata]|uniref:Uncharacterized protein n=1 Tax=Pseudomonas cremoricolorata TaxID=157783 RepID=A0A089WMJ9_9PSED|nr:SGNH/GDSL hydrolase family protein [Pseudomonas cremoricolorata]AIR90535.1 hypothetical protein LK03_15125 [Pseudomonas cremoricolorata]
MSGQDTLNQLDQTVAAFNELALSPEAKMVTLPSGSQKPTNAKIIADLATQMAGAQIYTTVALGLQATRADGYFSVVSASDADYIDLYRNNNGSAALVDTYPNSKAVKAVKQQVDSATAAIGQIAEVVQDPSSIPIADDEAAIVAVDQEGGEFLSITAKRTRTPALDAVSHAVESGIYDAEGGAVLHAGAEEISIGPLTIGLTSLPGIYVVDAEGSILQDLTYPGEAPVSQATPGFPLADGAYFAPKLVTAAGSPLHINVPSLISNRDLAAGLVASIWSTTTAASTTSNSDLVIQCSDYGAAARLKLRDPMNGTYEHLLDLQMIDLPVASSAGKVPNVLLIGDSISNRQGAQIMKAAIQRNGRDSNWIGTIGGSGVENQAYNESGPLGEAREAYETANFTYASITEITIPVPAGGESEYLALSKIERRNRNPFIRPATSNDDPAIVRNGYVLDFAFYQSRFNLQPPDVIVYGLGMNDFGKLSGTSAIQNYVNDNEGLMFARMRAAWPNAKIIRFLPGLPYQTVRNADWTNKYIPLIRSIMALHKGLANPNTVIVPSWAFSDPEVGYQTAAGTVDPVTGFAVVQLSDYTHPGQANRQRLFNSIAPYISASNLGLI